MWDEICLWYFECSASFFCEMWEKTVISFKCCYLWYENSMRWPPPLVLQQLYIKISLLRDVSIQPHVNVTYFHLKGTTRRSQVTRLFHTTWNLRCTELKIGFAVSDAYMAGPASSHLDLFQYSFPNRISGPLANQRVGNLQVSATTSKERWQSGRGKGDDLREVLGLSDSWNEMRFPSEG